MAERNTSAKTAAVMSTGAAIMAALAWLNSRKVEAAPPGTIPEELMNLVIAMAAHADSIDQDLDEVISAIKGISLEGGLGWPQNANAITSLRVAINPATGVQMPDIVIPSGMALVIMAWPLNPAWLQVGGSIAEASNINQSFPLMPTGIVGYQIENANQIYIAAAGAVAGCFACLTVEQRKGGGV